MRSSPSLCDGFNARKAAQAIAYLASKSQMRRLHVVKAIKLVYLADRKSIETYGFPILDEDRVSMKHGPVNSTTYSHIQGEYDTEVSGWSAYLRDRSNHEISAKKSVTAEDCDELSEADIGCLDAVWGRFGHMDQWQLRAWTHEHANVPEWEDPNGSSKLIPLSRIMALMAVENADRQAELTESFQNMDETFARLLTSD